MPPYRSYSFAYIVFGILIVVLMVIGAILINRGTFSNPQSNALVFYAGAWVAVFTLLANTWSQWRTSCTQMTISALQTLRTDREYLAAAAVLRAKLYRLSRPAPEVILDELRFPPHPKDEFEKPDFITAVYFVLNQYEFLAAGVRQGVLDGTLLKETIESAVCNLLDSIAPFVQFQRQRNPKTWRNLIWLYRRFRDTEDAADGLGPPV